MSISTPVLIIGSGPAGYTAAIYTARANLKPVLVSGYEVGGQLSITQDVENYPGFADPVMGPDLMASMQKQAINVGTQYIQDFVESLTVTGKTFVAQTANKQTIEAQSVILATGAQARWLGVPGESDLRGYGVSSCATCDGFFFKGAENICVVGGGNTAVEEAIFLSRIAQKVTLIHRRDSLRASAILQQRLFDQKNIEVRWNAQIQSINAQPGEKKAVKSVSITDDSGVNQLSTQAVFVAIGHTPSTQLVQSFVECDEQGYVLTKPGTTQTSTPGIFAAGDVQDKIYRQAITSAGSGCMAALDAEAFLQNH